MKFRVRSTMRIVAIILAMTGALSIAALAGGDGFGDDDDHSAEDGPSYFWFFVRDTSGVTIRMPVTVSLKNRFSIDADRRAGTYKARIRKDLDPKDVQVSCAKDGYKQLRVVRRSPPNKDFKIPIETECTLQRI